MIYFGTRLFGMVHLVPGRFYVSTKFLHIFLVPLIPLGSWIVTKESDRGWEGRPIGISVYSILMAWIRTALVLSYLGIAVMMFVRIFDNRELIDASEVAAFAGLSLLCILASKLTYIFSVAGTKRAQALALKLGYSEADAARIEGASGWRLFSRPTWLLAVALVPLLAWVGTGLVAGRFFWGGDPQTRPLEAVRKMKTESTPGAVGKVFSKYGPVTPAAVDTYRKYMSDPMKYVRYAAALALARIGDAGRAGIPELTQGLKDQDVLVCQRCIETLTELGSGYEGAIDNLMALVDDPNDEVYTVRTREMAAKALAQLGPSAVKAVPALQHAEKSKSGDVRKAAKEALEKIRGQDK